MTSMNEKPLNCTIKHSVIISPSTRQVGAVFHSGCKVIDVYFPSVINPEASHGDESIGAIQFQNDYVAFITIRAKMKGGDSTGKVKTSDQDWKTVINRFKLMPDCHAEMGSQDIFCLTRKQFACDLSSVISLRLILQQPSPVWKDFNIQKLKVFQSALSSKPISLPSWFSDGGVQKPGKKEIEGGLNIEALSMNLQQLWALSEEVSSNQPEETLGRYEIDGCYDINLLSYT
ncbi:Nicolin-1 [Bulinus truncatus]|nr:Nicolin-1 [Bulinus truncatus]